MAFTPEMVKERRRIMALFRALYVGDIQFPFNQTEMLERVGVTHIDGVCFAATLDWLRRYMWNCYAPLQGAKPKRSLNDPKYLTKDRNNANSLVHSTQFTTKLVRHQDIIETVKDPASARVGVFVKTLKAHATKRKGFKEISAKMTGLHGLESKSVAACNASSNNGAEHIFREGGPLMTLDACVQFAAYQQFCQNFEDALTALDRRMADAFAPAMGLLISIAGPHAIGAHAVMLFFDNACYRFFDPNMGEYLFNQNDRARLVTFVGTLWFFAYHRFLEMDRLAFSVVEYGSFGIGSDDHKHWSTLERSDSM